VQHITTGREEGRAGVVDKNTKQSVGFGVAVGVEHAVFCVSLSAQLVSHMLSRMCLLVSLLHGPYIAREERLYASESIHSAASRVVEGCWVEVFHCTPVRNVLTCQKSNPSRRLMVRMVVGMCDNPGVWISITVAFVHIHSEDTHVFL